MQNRDLCIQLRVHSGEYCPSCCKLKDLMQFPNHKGEKNCSICKLCMTKNKIEEKTAQKKQGKVVSTPAELFLREQFEYFLQFADSLSEDEVVYYKKFGMIMGRHYDNIQRSITCDQFCLEADKLNVNIERDPINTLRAAMEGFLTELHLQDRHFTIEESLDRKSVV